MSSTEVPPMRVPGAERLAAPLAHCATLLSLAAGAAGARVRRAPGAAHGGDPHAAGGASAPAAGVAPRRPSPRVRPATELHPHHSRSARGASVCPDPAPHSDTPALAAGGKEENQ